ncbi:DUF6531 domain-containing protein [Escherichia coli]
MGGKPAARQGDMTRKGLDIVQGSAGVLIGAPTGVACSVCPTGEATPKYGNPVNPLLGAKVLPGETDLALPARCRLFFPAPTAATGRDVRAGGGVWSRWKAPFDIRLQVHERELILNDNGGRSIHFEPLFPRRDKLQPQRVTLAGAGRGGGAAQFAAAKRALAGAAGRCSPESACVPATNSLQGPWWILGWPERVPEVDEVLPPEPPAYRVLTGVVDGFGRTLAFHRAAEGDVAGAVTGVTDGAGRRFHRR